MLCLTGNERTLADVSERMSAARGRLEGDVLHELRLDALARLDDEVTGFVERHAGELLVACRPVRQGGAFAGDEGERLGLLARVASRGPRWLDVEGDVDDAALVTKARVAGTKLLASWHELAQLPPDLEDRARTLRRHRPDAVKLAVSVDDVAELVPLFAAARATELPFVAVGMGRAGLLSRTHYASLGSLWTYVAADAAKSTAPGQLTLEEALAMNLPESARAPCYALVGGAQIFESPGRRIYNALFRRRGLASSYVPVVARSLEKALPILRQANARGLSVTMPLKQEALPLCEPDLVAREAFAVNSLSFDGGRWLGSNTDVAGVRAPIADLPGFAGLSRMLILGAGGAARAARVAARQLGLTVAVCARRSDEAREVAGPGGAYCTFDERHELGARAVQDGTALRTVLVNATPLSGDETPWPSDAPLPARLVFDTALGERRSSLLERARAEGAAVIPPQAMWRAQGAAQMSWFLGEPVAREELEE